MARKVIATDKAPAAVGPYSQAILADGWLFVSGQIGIDPGTGRMAGGGTVAEFRQVLSNLKAVVEAAGGNLQTIVRATLYLIDMNEFAAVNAVYAESFKESPPARECVAVAALPKGARCEMSVIARIQ
jgi:2-iminobutanoate/2-iminopropanoate deaminase